jgi:hypothetical protein
VTALVQLLKRAFVISLAATIATIGVAFVVGFLGALAARGWLASNGVVFVILVYFMFFAIPLWLCAFAWAPVLLSVRQSPAAVKLLAIGLAPLAPIGLLGVAGIAVSVAASEPLVQVRWDRLLVFSVLLITTAALFLPFDRLMGHGEG